MLAAKPTPRMPRVTRLPPGLTIKFFNHYLAEFLHRKPVYKEPRPMEEKKQTHQFKTEVRQILNLIVKLAPPTRRTSD